MNKLLLPLLIGLLTVCGCAHQYVIKFSNGNTITTASKPKLKGGSYHFKDAKGREVVIPAGRVIEVEPASMAEEEAKTKQFKTTTSTKPRHWYWPF